MRDVLAKEEPVNYRWDTSGKTPGRVRVGETISYSGGDIPYVDRVVEITPDTPKPDSEAMGYIKVLNALLREREREVERLWEENKRLHAMIQGTVNVTAAREREEELGHKRSSSEAQ